jgi:hypothetical protein
MMKSDKQEFIPADVSAQLRWLAEFGQESG